MSDRTTDAVVEARQGFAEQRYSPEGIVGRLVARIDDLEAKLAAYKLEAAHLLYEQRRQSEEKLAAMTRERDAACYAALEMRDTIKDLQAALEIRTAPPH